MMDVSRVFRTFSYLSAVSVCPAALVLPMPPAPGVKSEGSTFSSATVTALLNSLSMGFRAVAVNEKANEVRKLLAAAKQQYDKFGDVLQKARKKIDEAGRSLDEAQDRNRIIAGKLKGVEAMDSDEANTVLGILE